MLYLLKGEEFYGLIDFTLSSDNIFPAMSIFVLSRAIRFGAEYEFFTNATVGVGIFAAAFLYYDAFINYNGAIREFILPTLCLIFALLLKKIIRCFMEYFDKNRQIPVNPDEAPYRFEFNQDISDDFLNEDSRFNGKFKDYDNDD